MSVAVKKIDGVQSVDVSLNKGLVTIDLAPGNRLTMTQLRRVITSNGFSPKEAMVVVEGVLDIRSGAPTLRVDGTDETFVLVAEPNGLSSEDVKRLTTDRAHLKVTGRIDPSKGTEQLAVTAIKSVT